MRYTPMHLVWASALFAGAIAATLPPSRLAAAAADRPGKMLVAAPSTATASSYSYATLRVTIQDSSGNPLPDATVHVSSTSHARVNTAVEAWNITNGTGQVTFRLTDTTAEVATFTVAVLAPPDDADRGSPVIAQQVTVTFTTPRPPTSLHNPPPHLPRTPKPSATPTPAPVGSATAATAAPASTPAPFATTSADCSQPNSCWAATAVPYRGQIGLHLAVYCPAGVQPNYDNVYGTDIYTDDTEICSAAVHAGLIPWDGQQATSSATVTIAVQSGQQSYQGSMRNGIQSNSSGPTDGAYVFVH